MLKSINRTSLILISILFFLHVRYVSGQWQKAQFNMPDLPMCFAAKGSDIFVGTLSRGVYVSDITAQNWTEVNMGLPLTYGDLNIMDIKVCGTNIFLATNNGMYKSTNNGVNWSLVTMVPIDFYTTLTSSGNTIFAGTYFGDIYKSSNAGNTWALFNSGLPLNYSVSSLEIHGTKIFVASNTDMIHSSPVNSGNWQADTSGVGTMAISSFMLNNATLFAGTSNGVFKYDTSSGNWYAANAGMQNIQINSLTVFGSDIFAGTYSGVFVSPNHGMSWQNLSTGLADSLVLRVIAIPNGHVYAGTINGGVQQSINAGLNWSAANNGFPSCPFKSTETIGSNIIAASNKTMILSSNAGVTWNLDTLGIGWSSVNTLTKIGSVLISGNWSSGIFISNDNGISWSASNTGLPVNVSVNTLAEGNGSVYAGTWGDGIYESTDSGSSWSAVNSGLPLNSFISSLFVSGTTVFAGALGNGIQGLFTLNTGLGTWSQQTSGLPTSVGVSSFAVSGNTIFAGTDYDGIYTSTNSGTSWSSSSNGIINTVRIFSLFTIGSDVFAGTSNGIYLTNNMGVLWTTQNIGLSPNTNVVDFASDGAFLYAAANTGLWKVQLLSLPLSLNEFEKIIDIVLYPNPANDKIIIQALGRESLNGSISICDMQGRLIQSVSVNDQAFSNEISINIGELAIGNYIASISTSKGMYFEKLIVTR